MRLVIALFVLLALPVHAAAIPPPDPSRFADEIRAFPPAHSPSRLGPRPIVFYGSSSIRMWHDRLAADFGPGLWTVGRGFGGSTMSDAAYYVDRVVAPLHPWAVVLYEGDNDIEMGRTPDQVVADFDLLVAKLRTKVPNVQLFVLAIKPSAARWAKWPAMQATNAKLAEICRRSPSRLIFVDVATPLLGRNGLPRPEFYLDDRLHLSTRGYDTWRTVVQRALHDAERD